MKRNPKIPILTFYLSVKCVKNCIYIVKTIRRILFYYNIHFGFRKQRFLPIRNVIMNCLKCLAAALAGILVYTGVSIFAGQNGIKSFNQLDAQKMEISKQVASIEKINGELKLEKAALQYDPDVIAAYARKLGYVKEGEKLVKINGLKPFENTLYDTGTVLKDKEITYLPDSICKILGIIVFLMTMLLFIILDVMNGNFSFSKKKSTVVVQGIPVYDPKQI